MANGSADETIHHIKYDILYMLLNGTAGRSLVFKLLPSYCNGTSNSIFPRHPN